MKKSMVLCAALALVMGTYASARDLPLPSANGLTTANELDVSTVQATFTGRMRFQTWRTFDVAAGQTFTFTNNNDGIVNLVTSKKSELAGTIRSTIGVIDGDVTAPAGSLAQVVGGQVFIVNPSGFTVRPGFTFEGDLLGLALNDPANCSVQMDLTGAIAKRFMLNGNGRALEISRNGAITGNSSFDLEDGADFIATSQNGKNATFGDINAGGVTGYSGSAAPAGFTYVLVAQTDENNNVTFVPDVWTDANGNQWVRATYNTTIGATDGTQRTVTVNLPWAKASILSLNSNNKLTVKNVGTENNSLVALNGLNVKTGNLFLNNNSFVQVAGVRNTTIQNVSGLTGSTLNTSATFGKLKVNSVFGVGNFNVTTNNFTLSRASNFGLGTIFGSTVGTVPQRFSIARNVSWAGLTLGNGTVLPAWTTQFRVTPSVFGW